MRYLEKEYTVYKHISPNGKQYVGITSQSVEQRWNNGHGYRSNQYFTNAINKYGWDNFEHIILFDKLSSDEACEIEKKLIHELDLTNPKNGYNHSFGGEHGLLSEESKRKISEKLVGNQYRLGIPHSEKTKKKMSETRCGEQAYWYGKHHSSKSKNKLRNARLGTKASKELREKLSEIRTGENNPFYGKHHSEDTKEKLRQINLNKSVSEETRTKMSNSKKGVKFTEQHKENLVKNKRKPLYQIDCNGNIIKEWISCADVERTLGLKHISGVCRGERKSAGGYKWIYKEDYCGRTTND